MSTFLLTTLLLQGCSQNLPYNSMFDAPSASTVLPAGNNPFEQPLGFIANRRSGVVVPLDLQHNTPLSDQIAAPFLRPRGVAFGRNREIADIHVDTPADDRLTVFAIDQRTETLLYAPYIIGMSPEPQIVTPTYSDLLFTAGDTSTSNPTLTIEGLMPGATTTEMWTVTWSDGDQGWLVTGSQSGRQENILLANEVYVSDGEEIELSIDIDGSTGDTFTFTTDNHVIAVELGGMPVALEVWDEAHLLITVWDKENNQSWLTVYNKRQQVEVGRWLAPSDSQLGFMTRLNDQLWIADQHNDRLFTLSLSVDTADSLANTEYSEIPTLGPITDIATLDTDTYTHLYVASEQRVDIWDVNKEQWKHINPLQAFRGGVDVNSPVVGISSSQREIDLQTTSAWLAPKQDHVVVATLFNGSTVMLEGETGCIATVPGGSSLSLDGTAYGEIQFTDTGPTSNPTIFAADDGSMLSTSNCGGVLLDEDWTVTFDGRTGDWLVDGSRSGEQDNRAKLDSRYISDNGAFSFLIVSGGLPPTDGDTFSFSTLSNILELSLVTNSAGRTEALEVPASPTTFVDFADSDNGWDEATPNQYALIPITNTNVVLRLNLETWIVEHVWN